MKPGDAFGINGVVVNHKIFQPVNHFGFNAEFKISVIKIETGADFDAYIMWA